MIVARNTPRCIVCRGGLKKDDAMLEKPVKWRNRKYTDWVKSQPCAHCNKPADDPHHIEVRGLGKGTGTKISDCFTVPVCRPCHNIFQVERDEHYQMILALRTIEKALNDGILIWRVS